VADKLLVLTVMIVLVGRGVFTGWIVAAIAGLGGLAAAGALDDTIAEWALVIALALTWVSGLDYARLAPRLLRGDPTAGAARGAKSSESTFSSSPASRQTLR
jgi:hypothetical protein